MRIAKIADRRSDLFVRPALLFGPRQRGEHIPCGDVGSTRSYQVAYGGAQQFVERVSWFYGLPPIVVLVPGCNDHLMGGIELATTDSYGPSSAATSPQAVVIIETKGWTWMDRVKLAIFLCLYPVIVLFGAFIDRVEGMSGLTQSAVVVGGGLLLLFLVSEEITSVRRIELTSTGVTFRFPFHSEYRSWSDLEPAQVPASHGLWYAQSRFRNGKPASQRSFRLTLEQAKGILSHPACTKWKLQSQVASSLGVAQTLPPPS